MIHYQIFLEDDPSIGIFIKLFGSIKLVSGACRRRLAGVCVQILLIQHQDLFHVASLNLPSHFAGVDAGRRQPRLRTRRARRHRRQCRDGAHPALIANQRHRPAVGAQRLHAGIREPVADGWRAG
ncbi:hypothetical protein PATSB16_02350 [Pandoraea thiooxydans]|nr:hypothetical protein PATSB16_02350 [Pandoraea thiooxydans]